MPLDYITRTHVIHRKPTIKSMDWHLPTWLPNAMPTRLTDDEGEANTEQAQDVLLADPELKKPQMYAVVMYNDDYTPMEFVVATLQTHFKHSIDAAVNIMLAIHHQGKGIAGVYPKDIAETKAQAVNREARQAGYPLLSQIEPQS